MKERPRATFVYFYLMADHRARVRAVAPMHARYWQSLAFESYRGGPFVDRSGGLITFTADHRDAEAAVASDPFVREGLLESHWLREWRPADQDETSSR